MTELATQVSALAEDEKLKFFEQAIGNLTLGESLKLVKHLEDVFGIEATPKMPDFSQPPEDSAEEEQTEFDVVLTDVGSQKIAVIRAVRSVISGLSLKEAKDKLSPLPVTLLEKSSKEDAEKLKAVLEEAGATVEIK